MADTNRLANEPSEPEWPDLPLTYGDIVNVPELHSAGECRHPAIVACRGRVCCLECGEIIG